MPGKRNMYGCLPCPKCGSRYRAPYNYTRKQIQKKDYGTKTPVVSCDDCGREARWDGKFGPNGEVDEVDAPGKQ